MRKHSVSIRGHQTSFSLEDEFWQEFVSLAESEGVPVARLVTRIDAERNPDQNLSSAIRLFVLRKIKEKPES